MVRSRPFLNKKLKLPLFTAKRDVSILNRKEHLNRQIKDREEITFQEMQEPVVKMVSNL